MAQQKQKTVAKTATKQAPEVVEEKTADKGTALKEEMDALLDEIDGVLEENAEEFVRGYLQKGGE